MTKLDYLDLSDGAEGTEIYRPTSDDWVWTAGDVDPASCVLHLNRHCLDEVTAAVDEMRRHPLPTLLRAPEHFDLHHLRQVMAEAKARLDRVPGVAVVDALPLDGLGEEEAAALFWVLGQLLGRPVAQKWDGTMLYHVRDTGQAFGYGVRGSYTNVELVFHVDNAFGRARPDFVGLLCLRPAAEGGVTRFCSLHYLHQRMLEAYPELLARLYRPLLWDRQAEHAEGEPKVVRAPMFSTDGRRLRARLNISLVRKGYRIAGMPIDDEAEEALATFEDLVSDPEIWIELSLERGQLQYLNNGEIAHFRSRFTDHDDPTLKRHLVRTWHRDWGRPTYDG